jgi:predicted HicB family RNase H-like nuclease
MNKKTKKAAKIKYLQYCGFVGSVQFSKEDDVFFGKIEGIEDMISYESNCEENIEAAFRKAVDEYIKLLRGGKHGVT